MQNLTADFLSQMERRPEVTRKIMSNIDWNGYKWVGTEVYIWREPLISCAGNANNPILELVAEGFQCPAEYKVDIFLRILREVDYMIEDYSDRDNFSDLYRYALVPVATLEDILKLGERP